MRNHIKRRFLPKCLSLAAIVAVGASLAACGGGGTSDTGSTTTADSGGTTTAATTTSETTTASSSGSNGVINVGQTRMADSLNPLEGSAVWSLASHGISETIFKQNEDGELVSRFVSDVEQIDDHNWKVTLNKGVYYSDGSEVDAKALSEGMNKLIEKNELSVSGAAGKMTFTPTDDYTVNVETENVTRVLKSNLCEYWVSVFKDLGNGEFAYTGPYVPVNYVADEKIEMEPNKYYPDAEKRSNVNLIKFGDLSAMKLAYESGEIDMASTITAEVVDMLEKEGLHTETFDAGYQYFINCNTAAGNMSELAVRKAVNLGLDREDMMKVLKGGRIAKGIFANYYSFVGDNPTERNVEEAKKILDDAGWKEGSDGIREKDGKKLELRFITYAMRPDLPILTQLAVSQLEEIGIKCNAEIVDNITDTLKKGEFDLAFYATHTAPTGEPAYFLKMAFVEGGSQNYGKWKNEKVEELIKQMGEMPLGDERDKLAKEVQNIVYEELPVIYVIDPQWHMAVSEKLNGYKPYCGDYYTINEKLGLN